jgi:hypothetical protein
MTVSMTAVEKIVKHMDRPRPIDEDVFKAILRDWVLVWRNDLRVYTKPGDRLTLLNAAIKASEEELLSECE